MICRHRPGDPSCTSHSGAGWYDYERDQAKAESARLQQRLTELTAELSSGSPDADKYIIEQVERIGPHLVVRARYPNCAKCAFEGNKVMVFLNVTEAQALQWRRIDPHFRSRAPDEQPSSAEAPSPAARFPATPDGWADAITYASGKRTLD